MRQAMVRRRPAWLWYWCAIAGSALNAGGPSWAATSDETASTGASGPRLTPIAALTQTFTSHLQAGGVTGGADSVTDAMVGVIWRSGAGLVTGEVDYRLSALSYARAESKNTLRQNLRAHGDGQWPDQRVSVSAEASISQQAISAFAFQPVGGPALASDNTTDTVSVRLAPRWWGLLPGGLRLDVSGELGATEVSSTDVGDNWRASGGLHVAPQSQTRLGWSADLQTQRLDYRGGRGTDTTTAFCTLTLRLDEIDGLTSLSAGRQRSNLMTAADEDYGYWNVSTIWRPSPRTNVRADIGRQAIGRTHALTLEHRTALTSWAVSQKRSLSSSTQSGTTLLGTAFDLFYAMFASREPDPVKRADLVNSVLRDRGISSDAPVAGGYLASSATVVESGSFSAAWQWQRSSAMLVLMRGSSRRAGQMLTAVDDLSTTNEIRNRGAVLTLTHAVSPVSSVNLTLNTQASRGDAETQRHDQQSANLVFASRVSPRVGWSLGVRRSLFTNGGSSYDENALIGAVTAEF